MVKGVEAAGLPLGNPDLEKEEEYKLRRELVEKALVALQTEVEDQTIFE